MEIFPLFFLYFLGQTSVFAVLPSIFQAFFLALEENNKSKPRRSVRKKGKGFLRYFLFPIVLASFRVGKTITWPEQNTSALCTGLKFQP